MTYYRPPADQFIRYEFTILNPYQIEKVEFDQNIIMYTPKEYNEAVESFKNMTLKNYTHPTSID